jgi:hypothetical protein
MGYSHKSTAINSSISAKASEDSQNQGFLKFLGEKSAHVLEVAGSMKSRKGLKSGEPFSVLNHINH